MSKYLLVISFVLLKKKGKSGWHHNHTQVLPPNLHTVSFLAFRNRDEWLQMNDSLLLPQSTVPPLVRFLKSHPLLMRLHYWVWTCALFTAGPITEPEETSYTKLPKGHPQDLKRKKKTMWLGVSSQRGKWQKVRHKGRQASLIMKNLLQEFGFYFK